MIVAVVLRLLITGAAFVVAVRLLDDMDVSGGFWGYVWIAIVFGVVNTLIGTILRVLSLPLMVLTFGLFAIIVNALLLAITDALTDRLTIDEFWWTTVWAALIISAVSLILERVLGRPRRRRRRPATIDVLPPK